MIIRSNMIRRLKLRDESGYRLAQKHYITLPHLRLEDDILWYLQYGWVYASPTSFALACMINIAPEDTNLVQPAWFIRYAIGDLHEILSRLPGYLEYMVWCRNDEEGGMKLRKYRTKRLYALAGKFKLGAGRTESGNGAHVANTGSTPVRPVKQGVK